MAKVFLRAVGTLLFAISIQINAKQVKTIYKYHTYGTTFAMMLLSIFDKSEINNYQARGYTNSIGNVKSNIS